MKRIRHRIKKLVIHKVLYSKFKTEKITRKEVDHLEGARHTLHAKRSFLRVTVFGPHT